MKRIKVCLLLMFMFFLFNKDALAYSFCSDEREIELSALANNVNVNYMKYEKYSDAYMSETFGEQTRDISKGFYITIFNLTEDLNAKIVNGNSKKSIIVSSKNADDNGIVYVDVGEANSIKNYTITIRSNDDNCMNEVLKVKALTIPMKNDFYDYALCQENPEFEMCSEYTMIDYTEVSDREFSEKLNEYIDKNKDNNDDKESFFKKVYMFLIRNLSTILIVSGILVISGGATYIYYIRKKRLR